MSPLATGGKRKFVWLIVGRRPYLCIDVAAGDPWEAKNMILILPDGQRPYLCIDVAAGDYWERKVVWLINGRRPWLCTGVAAGDQYLQLMGEWQLFSRKGQVEIIVFYRAKMPFFSRMPKIRDHNPGGEQS